MNEERLFYHECRAAGLVFKDSGEWCDWLSKNQYDTNKPVAEVEGFKYTINDVCTNPHVLQYELDDMRFFVKVETSKTQFGWIWGYHYGYGRDGTHQPATYPSRYDNSAIFYETEANAQYDALTFLVRQLNGQQPKTKNINLLIWACKKMRASIVHPQQELFGG